MYNKKSARGKKVLVTGAAGFLGSTLCRRLLADGHEVAGLDNYFAGTIGSIKQLCQHGRFTMYRDDIAVSCLDDHAFDEIFDLAGLIHGAGMGSGPADCPPQADGWSMCRMPSRARIVQMASGTAVWPRNQTRLRRGERGGDDNGSVKRLRIFNAYGPQMSPSDQRAIPQFIVNALRGTPIVIHGDGCQVRSFCFVDDIIEGMIKMMAAPDDVVGPIDLGSREFCMILDLVNMIVEVTNSRSLIEFEPLAATGPAYALPDLARARAYLDWSARMPIRIGLAETIDYVDRLLSRGRRAMQVVEPTPMFRESVVA